MANPSCSSHIKSYASNRSPFFNGINLPYWKAKMTLFLQSTDLELWYVIEDGLNLPSKMVDGVMVPKTKHEWDEYDKRNFQSNAKVMYTLQCAMDRNEYNRIFKCKTAKKIWRLLEVTHKGTNQVKESKINMLVHSYKLFSMKDNETIVEMITRFTEIVNGLEALGKTYRESENMMKILRSVPSRWDTKVTAIQEAKDLTKLPLGELIGSLTTYEINLTKKQQEEEDKEKSIALKSTTKEEEEIEEEKESEEVDDLALITRKFNKFMRGGKYKGRRLSSRKESSSNINKEKKFVVCFKCKKLGHIKFDCPLYKSEVKRRKKKVIMATWSESENESSKNEK